VNGLEFFWCDRIRSTIADMVDKYFAPVLYLTGVTKEERDQVTGKDKVEKHMEACKNAAATWRE
jgi:hypothetical protein